MPDYDSTPNIHRFDDHFDESSLESINIRKLPPASQRDFRSELKRRDETNRREKAKRQEDEEEELNAISNLEKEMRKLPPQAMKNFRTLIAEAKENGLKGKELADFVTEHTPSNVDTSSFDAASNVKETIPSMKSLLSETKEPTLGEETVLSNAGKEVIKSKEAIQSKDTATQDVKIRSEGGKVETSSSLEESVKEEKTGVASRKPSVNPFVRETALKESERRENVFISKKEVSDETSEKALSTLEGHAQAPLKSIKERIIPQESFPQEEIPLSPDDLVSAKEELAFTQTKDQPPASPFVVYKETAEKGIREPSWASMVQTNTDSVISNRESPAQVKPVARFNVEHPDMPYINLMNASGIVADNIQQGSSDLKASAVLQLKDIVEQIIRRLAVLENKGKTDTIIILKHPPLFDGAQVVITSFSTATREFNLAFENLRPDAQKLINDNINSLRIALAEEGSVKALHIVTTTTLVEHHLPDFRESERSRERGEGEGGKQQKEEQEDLA